MLKSALNQTYDWRVINRVRDKTNLTRREMQVLLTFLEGHDNSKDVARRIACTPRTVEVHLYRIRQKLGVRTKTLALVMIDRLLRQASDRRGMRRILQLRAILHLKATIRARDNEEKRTIPD